MEYNNKATASGTVMGEAVFSHEVFGEKFYNVNLQVKRLSQINDLLPLTVSERIRDTLPTQGERISVEGQFRSYNKTEGDKSRLMLTLFARTLTDAQEEDNTNLICLSGYVCKPPVFRVTPFMREICDCLLAVNRAYGKSDYIPCIAWGRNAKYLKNMQVGDLIGITGRIQSREYQKKLSDTDSQIRIAYEVSISKIEKLESGTCPH